VLDWMAYGVSFRWRQGATFDPTSLLAMLAALMLVRFAVGVRLTPVSVAAAAFGGALWALAAAGWGPGPPTVAAVVIIVALRAGVRRARAA
jgi:hypothetical protein